MLGIIVDFFRVFCGITCKEKYLSKYFIEPGYFSRSSQITKHPKVTRLAFDHAQGLEWVLQGNWLLDTVISFSSAPFLRTGDFDYHKIWPFFELMEQGFE